jgi:hypothetical protein
MADAHRTRGKGQEQMVTDSAKLSRELPETPLFSAMIRYSPRSCLQELDGVLMGEMTNEHQIDSHA